MRALKERGAVRGRRTSQPGKGDRLGGDPRVGPGGPERGVGVGREAQPFGGPSREAPVRLPPAFAGRKSRETV